jgi:hypothetical protein
MMEMEKKSEMEKKQKVQKRVVVEMKGGRWGVSEIVVAEGEIPLTVGDVRTLGRTLMLAQRRHVQELRIARALRDRKEVGTGQKSLENVKETK